MKKVALSILVIVMTLSGCSFNDFQKAHLKNFVKHFDNSDSKIYKNCSSDSDCKLKYIWVGCPNYEWINVNNLEYNFLEYIKKETELIKNIEFDCLAPLNIKTINAICKEHICSIWTKK